MHNTVEQLLHQMRSWNLLTNAFWQALHMTHEEEPIAPTELLRKAADGLERLGRYGEEAEETRHALVAADLGRGDRGGRNAGHGGKKRVQQHERPTAHLAVNLLRETR